MPKNEDWWDNNKDAHDWVQELKKAIETHAISRYADTVQAGYYSEYQNRLLFEITRSTPRQRILRPLHDYLVAAEILDIEVEFHVTDHKRKSVSHYSNKD